jgi:hypothetical protein
MKVNERNHFELACKTLKLDPTKLPDVSGLLEEFARPLIALYKVQVIVKAWNGSWVADWNDYSQRKWFCWWWMDKPGFRFGVVDYDLSCTGTSGGSRLAFASEKLAGKAGKELDYLFADLMGGQLPEKVAA